MTPKDLLSRAPADIIVGVAEFEACLRSMVSLFTSATPALDDLPPLSSLALSGRVIGVRAEAPAPRPGFAGFALGRNWYYELRDGGASDAPAIQSLGPHQAAP